MVSETKHPTVTMPPEMVDAIDDQLEYGESRAGWIREAVRQRLSGEDADADVDG